MNLYVGNLLFDVTEDDLKAIFEPFGQITEIRLIMDKFTGKSKGFGFIEMPSKDEAQKAITELNGKDMKGRAMTVNEAKPQPERSGGGRSSFGDRGGTWNKPSGGDRRW